MKKLFIGLVLFSVVLAGCGGSRSDEKNNTDAVKGNTDTAEVSSKTGADEKQRYINAAGEISCALFRYEDLSDPNLDKEARAIYKKYGFDSDDEEAVMAIEDKYSKDEDVQDAIAEALLKCGGGGEGSPSV